MVVPSLELVLLVDVVVVAVVVNEEYFLEGRKTVLNELCLKGSPIAVRSSIIVVAAIVVDLFLVSVFFAPDGSLLWNSIKDNHRCRKGGILPIVLFGWDYAQYYCSRG